MDGGDRGSQLVGDVGDEVAPELPKAAQSGLVADQHQHGHLLVLHREGTDHDDLARAGDLTLDSRLSMPAGGDDPEKPVVRAQLGEGVPLARAGEIEKPARLLGGEQDALHLVEGEEPMTTLQLLADRPQQCQRGSCRWRGRHRDEPGAVKNALG